MNDLEAFAKLAIALQPWRHQIVFAGGWAYRLYRQHPLAIIPPYDALYTRDADVALGDKDTFEGNIKEALAKAGFHEQLESEFRPPVSKYTLGTEEQGFYAEFLTTLRGSGVKRSGEPDATTKLAGVTAQKLRYMDLLLIEPWQISLASDDKSIEPLDGLQIPNPVAFIAQKLLIHENRKKEKRPQDVLYIYDTLELFGARVEVLTTTWKKVIVPLYPEREVAKVIDARRQVFSKVTDTLREAARIPSDRTLEPDDMLGLCSELLDEIFE
ncbi:GSU2403 family nucleotidyltransferase fold protein [Cupriavidus pampae]|uniref:Nucleotidyltransferase-like domain-containing protein n=1 Tax=Cupriavidus pampae TaxID=659251 RepID=A0ABN7XW24_9BURK|nr:GSU2403 family nucleotidyltransferase fold protein [Cupriavidus pampae]CAG9164301.1 hypothetical protein LMG32289_00644 [Cupriavidus pampae]